MALCGNLSGARDIANALSERLNVPLVVKRVDRDTDIHAFLGDPRNPVSYRLTKFWDYIKAGGLVLIEAQDTSTPVIKSLQLLEPFLPKGRRPWRVPEYASFDHVTANDNFYIIVSIPELPNDAGLPPSLSSRLDVIQLPPDTVTISLQPAIGRELGPGNVLILMKFKVGEYERWYQDVLRPIVSKFGVAVRMDGSLEDWQSDVTRAIGRADAIIIDLSHDVIGTVSQGVLWELNRLWQDARSKRTPHKLRDKLIVISRGLDGIDSMHPNPEFVYSSEIAGELIKDMPTRAAHMDDLLGFEVRRYSTMSDSDLGELTAWLERRLRPLVQNIPSPITDSELRRLAKESSHNCQESLAASWLKAIGDRDFGALDELNDGREIPSQVAELVGLLLTTVTVYETVTTTGYWGLTRLSLATSPELRHHYMKLLATSQLSVDHPHPFISSFCENVWHAFNRIAASLPESEKRDLSKLAPQEQRMGIREVSDGVLVALLPEAERTEALTRLLMEHLASREITPE